VLRIDEDSVDAALRAENGAGLGRSSRPLRTDSPREGAAEQRPEAWWEACLAVVTDLRAAYPFEGVRTVETGGTLEALVLLDGEREVIRPAILARDERAAGGLAAPLAWLRQHESIAFKRVRHVLTPASYLRLMLTGELAMDARDAVQTALFDEVAGAWSALLCERWEINGNVLPRILAPGERIAVTVEAASRLGVPAGAAVG